MRRALPVTAAALVLLAVLAGPAVAHARLISTDPPGGATVEQAPDHVALTFSERIETSFGGVQVFDPAGERVDAGDAQITDTRVQVPLAPLEAAGSHTVVFRVISGDGHPVESRFSFEYQPQTSPLPTPTGSPTPATDPTPTAGPTPTPSPAETATAAPAPARPANPTAAPADFDLEDAGTGTTVGLWTSRLVNYLALTAVVGLLLAAAVLLAAGGGLSGRQRGVVRLAAVAGGLWALSAVALFVFGLSTVAARPLPDALSGDLPARFAATRFGYTTLAQGGVAVATTALALLARSRRGVLAALAAAALGGFAPAWWGHAGTAPLPVMALASDWVHVLATTTWVGGLAALAVLLLGTAGTEREFATPAQRFSRIAGWAIAAVLVTGTVNSLLHIDAANQLWTTTWGRLVLAKVALFASIAWLGWRNRRRLLPRLTGEHLDARKAFRTLALAEVALMAAAFGVATGLASSIPADAEAAARIQSVVTAFGDGQINLTVDPATAGDNVMHLYFLGPTGQQRDVDDPTLTLTSDAATIEPVLLTAGTGHYTVLNERIDASGEYRVTVTATSDGERLTTTASITIG